MSLEYQPGVCNIGGPEVKRRKQVSYLGATGYLALTIASLSLGLSQQIRALVFFPALLFAVGYIQSRKKFCFAFGLLGTFNFGELGKMSKVASPSEIAADRKAALTIIGQALALALAMTLLVLSI
jgi:hypothetical protein